MAYTATCPSSATVVNDAPGYFQDPYYFVGCSVEWESGAGEGTVVSCATSGGGPPGNDYGPEYGFEMDCMEPFTSGSEDPPDDPPDDGFPEGLDLATAGEMFSMGFTLIAAFWALGKGIGFVMSVVKRL